MPRVNSREFIDHVLDLLAPFGACTALAMFGGHGIYREGQIFGILIDDRLYLKAAADDHARLAAAGSAPFVYRDGKREIAMSYWSVPDEAMDSPADMLPWARSAWSAACSKALARKPKGPKRPDGAKTPRCGGRRPGQ
jgi:DNA transformation protein